MITPLRRNYLFSWPNLRKFTSKIVSVEAKRSEKIILNDGKSAVSADEPPTFLPSSNFLYDYKPMAIFEEKIGKPSQAKPSHLIL